MNEIRGLFDTFDNLEQINIESVALWLKKSYQVIPLENYLANRILYPQTIPVTESDLEIDLAILREALRLSFSHTQQNNFLGGNPFFNLDLRKIIIPRRFLEYVGELVKLIWVFVDIIPLESKRKDWFSDLWTIVLSNETDVVVGSLILPQFKAFSSEINFGVLGKNYKIKQGSLVVIPCSRDRCEISYKISHGSILGKSENSVEVAGGSIGIVIDARKR